MPYNKEQLRAYWETNKVILNQRRKEKRRLAKSGLAILEVSHNSPGEVSHLGVSQKQKKVSHHQANVVEMANPTLTRLIQEWQTQTNYSCPPTCLHSYCSNCWYFAGDKLIDYKEVSV